MWNIVLQATAARKWAMHFLKQSSRSHTLYVHAVLLFKIATHIDREGIKHPGFMIFGQKFRRFLSKKSNFIFYLLLHMTEKRQKNINQSTEKATWPGRCASQNIHKENKTSRRSLVRIPVVRLELFPIWLAKCSAREIKVFKLESLQEQASLIQY